jgi:rod shape determining protein RodA
MLRIDRRLVAHIEWPLLLLTLLILASGLLTIASATHRPGRPLSPYVIRQAVWTAAGLVALLAAVSIDYRALNRWGYAAYAATVLLLALVPILGLSAGGARRWLGVGAFSIQPSEVAKIGLVIGLACHLQSSAGARRLPLVRLVVPGLFLAVPALLILRQPDLGTVIVLGLGALTVLLASGLPMRLVLIALCLVGPALPYAWSHLKPYQQKRILTFVDPDSDPLGAGYHVRQSRIAIGSGQVYGKGYLQGTQNQLNFLPEEHTDFIFSVYAEEWGFAGSIVLLVLYASLVVRGAVIAGRARDNLGALLAAGLTGMIFWQVVINIAMATGSLPVVGITLPFLSYGGSSLLVLLTSVGLVMNVSMRRYMS